MGCEGSARQFPGEVTGSVAGSQSDRAGRQPGKGHVSPSLWGADP